jgi:hypothetical protein
VGEIDSKTLPTFVKEAVKLSRTSGDPTKAR